MDCPKCGFLLAPLEKECPRCRRLAADAFARSPAAVWPPPVRGQEEVAASVVVPPVMPPPAPNPPAFEEGNSSGEERGVPAEVAALKWNWGAFFCGWLWCFFQRLPGLALVVIGVGVVQVVFAALFLLPYGYALPSEFMGVVGFGLNCHLGLNGHRLAWERRRYSGGVAQFVAVQRAWLIAGVIGFVLGVLWGADFLYRFHNFEVQKAAAARSVRPSAAPDPGPAVASPPRPPETTYRPPVMGGQGFRPPGGFQRQFNPNYRGDQPPVRFVPLPNGGFQAEPNLPPGVGNSAPPPAPLPGEVPPEAGEQSPANGGQGPGVPPEAGTPPAAPSVPTDAPSASAPPDGTAGP